jgi:hypothetical protein
MKALFVLAIALLIVFASAWVMAQDTPTPEIPTPEATEVIPVEPPTPALPPSTETPENIIGIVLAALYGGAATIAGSLIVTSIVSLLKFVVPSTIASGDMLKNTVSVVIWIAYSIAIKFGLGTEFNGVSTAIAPVLTALLPLIGTLIGASKLYQAAKGTNTPILGYSRSK